MNEKISENVLVERAVQVHKTIGVRSLQNAWEVVLVTEPKQARVEVVQQVSNPIIKSKKF